MQSLQVLIHHTLSIRQQHSSFMQSVQTVCPFICDPFISSLMCGICMSREFMQDLLCSHSCSNCGHLCNIPRDQTKWHRLPMDIMAFNTTSRDDLVDMVPVLS